MGSTVTFGEKPLEDFTGVAGEWVWVGCRAMGHCADTTRPNHELEAKASTEATMSFAISSACHTSSRACSLSRLAQSAPWRTNGELSDGKMMKHGSAKSNPGQVDHFSCL